MVHASTPPDQLAKALDSRFPSYLASRLSRTVFANQLALSIGQEPATDSTSVAPANPYGNALITVHGIVRNAATGDPLPRALVRIQGAAATGALTDGEGRFEIPSLAAGPQIFEVLKPGYEDSAKANLTEGDRAVFSVDGGDDGAASAHSVILAVGMPDLEFALSPTSAIHGRIELSTGDPAQGIDIQLLKRTIQDGRAVWQSSAQSKTLSDGSYRFGNLSDGQYAVYTQPALESEPVTSLFVPGRGPSVVREGYASQFYPEARDLAGAAKITLRGGEQVQANLNLTLEPFRAVTATVTFPSAGKSASSPERSAFAFNAVVMDGQGHQLPYGAQFDMATQTLQAMLPDGTYSILLVATPSYTISVATGGNAFIASHNAEPLAGSVEFSVAGHAISNLRIPLSSARGGAVQVTVQRSQDAPQNQPPASQGKGKAVLVTFSQTGGWLADGASNAYAQGEAPGSVEANYLPPGLYWVHTHFMNKNLCESSFTASGANLAHEPLTLGISGPSAPLELTARDDCARLTLTLPASLAALTAGEEHFATVYVVPDFDSTTDVEPITLRPTTSTSITVEGLTPGAYHVYTFPAPVALEYRNRNALAALSNAGQAVTLSPAATTSLVLETTGMEAPEK